MASPSAGATALKYGDVNTVTPSPGEVKGLISCNFQILLLKQVFLIFYFFYFVKISIFSQNFDISLIYLIFAINPLTSPGEGVTVFTSPYLSAGAPALGEAKGLMIFIKIEYYKKYLFN